MVTLNTALELLIGLIRTFPPEMSYGIGVSPLANRRILHSNQSPQKVQLYKALKFSIVAYLTIKQTGHEPRRGLLH